MAQVHQKKSVPPAQKEEQVEMVRFRLNIAEKGDYGLEKMKRNGWVESGHQLPDPRHIEMVIPKSIYDERKQKHRDRAARFLHSKPTGKDLNSRMTNEATELHIEDAQIEIID